MGTQHTSGPWLIGKDDETGGVPYIQIENDTQAVCEVSSVLTDWDRSEFEITDEVRANPVGEPTFRDDVRATLVAGAGYR